ncbi:hypothetical protein RhiirC2_783550, partial [Rhizophagus irregularis]
MSSHYPESTNNTIDNNSVHASMEDIVTTSPTQALSQSEIEVTSRDSIMNTEKDVHTQAPITDNLTFMDEDPKET